MGRPSQNLLVFILHRPFASLLPSPPIHFEALLPSDAHPQELYSQDPLQRSPQRPESFPRISNLFTLLWKRDSVGQRSATLLRWSCNVVCRTEGVFIQDFWNHLRNVRRQSADFGEVSRVSAVPIGLANPSVTESAM
jgi:hypothetical protein